MRDEAQSTSKEGESVCGGAQQGMRGGDCEASTPMSPLRIQVGNLSDLL